MYENINDELKLLDAHDLNWYQVVSFIELPSPQPSVQVKLERQFYVENFTQENQSLV